MGSTRGFSTEFLRDIPYREIYWVCSFCAKRDHASFVGRNVNRDDRHPWKFLLEFFLYKRIRYACLSVKWGEMYLASPPPVSCMHFRINLHFLIRTSEMFLWCVNQKLCKFWVSIQDTDTLCYIAMVKFVGLAGECNLFSVKFRESIWQFFVDDCIEIIGTRK